MVKLTSTCWLEVFQGSVQLQASKTVRSQQRDCGKYADITCMSGWMSDTNPIDKVVRLD